ncbi:MAG: biopolymer transporter TolR, partial [Cytophagaceae bacterium]
MKLLVLTLLSLLGLLLHPASTQAQQVGDFAGQQDVGTGVKPGAGTYLPGTQQYVVTGAGANIWGDHDEFHYAYKQLAGDFILYARAGFVGRAGVELHRKMGWMVRQSLAGNAPHVSAAVHGDGLTSLQYRKTAGGATEETRAQLTYADVVQLERRGRTYTMRVAQFGQPFETVQVADFDLGDAVYVGLFVCSHNADVAETAVFRDVRLSVPAPAGLVAYQQYLGSRLELLEIATGNREVIFTAPGSIQAPNWRPDNSGLLYNSDGLMYSLDLGSRQAKVLPTGEVKNNNNDHVLSFDGRQLGLSSGVDARGGSVVYTVPATGGTPRLVTPKGPSYLHSWTPDGRSLLFTGQRGGDFDIYRVPATGGREVRLTT